ncbi:MPT63 family protein [Mycobacterium cookii]|nr:MPT63 family protein [Mycobacterium cookii]MCV7329186.1 MPT63 family protein [Mycobacterium cookii]
MKTAIGAAGITAVSLVTAGSAAAAPNIQGFGTSEPLIDGPMVTNYTVSNLQPSTISIPGYTPKGTLYQADVTVRSDGGVVTPQVRDFSARGPNGQTYKLIDNVQAPNGLNPAPIAQGSESKGTLYFDATGAPPNGVVYNDGLQDILMWTSNVPGSSMPGQPSNAVPAPGQPSNSGPAPGQLPAPATT